MPIFKKKDRANVENYIPVSILPNLSRVYERRIYIQIYEYLQKILSKCAMWLLSRLECTTLPSLYGRKMKTVPR